MNVIMEQVSWLVVKQGQADYVQSLAANTFKAH